MAEESGWLIERYRGNDYSASTEYLTFYGYAPHFAAASGQFRWGSSATDALRFARRTDGTMFIAAMRSLSLIIPHGQTLPGLRHGDPDPLVCEHMWVDQRLVDPPALSSKDTHG